MGHMGYTGVGVSCADGGCSSGTRIVSYIATGTELPAGFTVDIGTTLAAATYRVTFWGVESDVIVPITWSFPTASKTVTTFQARFAGDGLTAGGVYYFQIKDS